MPCQSRATQHAGLVALLTAHAATEGHIVYYVATHSPTDPPFTHHGVLVLSSLSVPPAGCTHCRWWCSYRQLLSGFYSKILGYRRCLQHRLKNQNEKTFNFLISICILTAARLSLLF